MLLPKKLPLPIWGSTKKLQRQNLVNQKAGHSPMSPSEHPRGPLPTPHPDTTCTSFRADGRQGKKCVDHSPCGPLMPRTESRKSPPPPRPSRCDVRKPFRVTLGVPGDEPGTGAHHLSNRGSHFGGVLWSQISTSIYLSIRRKVWSETLKIEATSAI